MSFKFNIIIGLVFTCFFASVKAEDGHQLWLRFSQGTQPSISCNQQSPTIQLAVSELKDSWKQQPILLEIVRNAQTRPLGKEGFVYFSDGKCTHIQALSDIGLLYGSYALLREQQCQTPLSHPKAERPSYDLRILNHWDNLNGSIERGYAGLSIFWNEKEMNHPQVTAAEIEKWKAYGRANASIGINGTVLNNVNSNPKVLSEVYLEKIKAIADVLRPYGLKVYLSINFSSPTALGGLKTSDPLDKEVIRWWKDKAKEIYQLIPDFGGFLVKANSEGLPGPQDFGRTHAEGANMLADALQPYKGIIMWRAFVYAANDADRAKQAYQEFMPLDGKFRKNVIVQVKNGPIDFQPREPINPLFGAMKETPIMPELQITMEYLGQERQLTYLGTQWQDFLQTNTYHSRDKKELTVASSTDYTTAKNGLSAIAGVANIGLDKDWCGHQFNQANWYAFGRLAWNDQLSAEKIADEWIQQTFTPIAATSQDIETFSQQFLQPVKKLMMDSWKTTISYMMPYGLHHIFAGEHHYGPEPWYAPKGCRSDWTCPYYHKADSNGLGFDRSHTGSNAVAQYASAYAQQLDQVETCPEELLLWFHHVSWNYQMKNKQTLWNNLCHQYNQGVQKVNHYQVIWNQASSQIDAERAQAVLTKLREQLHDAIIWKDACLLYFQQHSCQPFPADIQQPEYNLNELVNMMQESRKYRK